MAKEITNNQVVEILRKEIGGVRNELKGDIGSLRGELKAEIQSTKVEVKSARAEIQSVKKDLTKKIDEDTGFLARITNSNFTKVEKKINTVHKDLKADFSQLNKKVDAEVERKDDIDLRINDVKTRVTVSEKQAL